MNSFNSKSELESIRRGESQTEFNSNQAVIFYIADIDKVNVAARLSRSIEGVLTRLECMKALDMVVHPLLNPDEEADLARVRIVNIPPPSMSRQTGIFVSMWGQKIDEYERKIRHYLYVKGLGVTGKKKESPGDAVLR